MSRARAGILSLAVGTALIVSEAPVGAIEPPPPEIRGVGADHHSYSRPDRVRVTRVVLDLSVDFSSKVLKGTATLSLKKQPGATGDEPLILDTKGLKIEDVSHSDGETTGVWKRIPFSVGKESHILGAALVIPVSEGRVRVSYKTTETSSALQWIDAKGTAGGRHPFLFTQSEAIHARSWIPLQDSPGVRVEYEATVRVPDGLRAIMSADRLEGRDEPGVFHFEMKQPIPSYLIALAVGDLSFRPISARTGVFAEPSVVEAAAREFADVEAMVKTIESTFGQYRWGRYDILVLPPSFPFGGMENPKLTFATPTVLAGDRSLVSLIAHELAHSWSGNLVTNATWRDFWLNEGFTTYIERRVMEDLYGAGRAAMERVLGRNELDRELAALPPREQVLHIDLDGRDPDEGMTRVPYEKGALFLTALEQAFGRKSFDDYLRNYFDRFAFRSITTENFVSDLKTRLFASNPDAAKAVDVSSWLEMPGLPAGAPAATSDRFHKVEAVARHWIEGKTTASRLPTSAWTTQEWLHFLQSIPQTLPADRMAELDQALGLTARGNAEISAQWLVITVRNKYAPADERLESFLTTIGRRKFLTPIYSELLKTPEGAVKAKAIYAKARPFYHPIAVDTIDKLFAQQKPE